MKIVFMGSAAFSVPSLKILLENEWGFAKIIMKAGYASPIRTPRGRDVMAACGQLKSLSIKQKKLNIKTLWKLEKLSNNT